MTSRNVISTSAEDRGPLETISFLGLAPGPHLLVFGAVHGNETCGPHAIARAVADCREGRLTILRGEVTFLPVANPKAFRLGTREGERNLNRDLYEKPVAVDYEDRIGNRLCALLRRHDVLLDLHSFRREGPPFVFFGPQDNAGEREPFRHGAAEQAFAACLGPQLLIHGWLDLYARLIAARAELGLPALKLTEGFGTTEYMRFSGGYGVTLECGNHTDPRSPEIGHAAILNALRHLGLVETTPAASAAPRIIEMTELVICERPGDRLEGQWATGDAIAAGDVVARRADGTAVTARAPGIVIFPDPAAAPGEGICYLGTASPRA